MNLQEKTKWVRQQVLEMIVGAGHGHIGGSLSCVEILVALYQGGILWVDPKNPGWEDRDRFILSKGQGCQALYAVLADMGFFPVAELEQFGKEGSRLEGHPSWAVPGIEVNTGSLGNGLGIGAGLALSARLQGKNYRVFVLLGDAECHEGSVWEAAMFAAHHRLGNLIAIIDDNGLSATDFTSSVMRVSPLAAKWDSFGWNVHDIDGHSLELLIGCLGRLKRSSEQGTPKVIVASTTKGRGVSFMAMVPRWHHAVPSGEDLEQARAELWS